MSAMLGSRTRIREAIDWASANGLMVRSREQPNLFDHAPFTLKPTSYPRDLYEQACSLAVPFGLIVDRIARDPDWLRATLLDAAAVDPFVAKQLEIFDAVLEEGISQKSYLGIHRSDYMMHQPDGADSPNGLLQVELNTIASSFGCLSTQVSRMHRYLESLEGKSVETMPHHDTTANIASGIAGAHKHYVDTTLPREGFSSPLAVLFVVQDGETNSVDQRMLEYAVVSQINSLQQHQSSSDPAPIRVIRRSLTDLKEQNICRHTAINSGSYEKRALIVDDHEISVVYYRAGYTPRDYPSQAEWDARLFVERSHAIKCPSIAYQLVGAKKVQQQLANKGELERFISEEEGLSKVRESFAELYSVDEASVAMVLASGGKGFVMKPQREGGGNNIYETDIPAALNSMNDLDERRAYIFMSMIRPPAAPAVLVRSGAASKPLPTLCELGIFSTFLGNGSNIVYNEFAGHLLRTKPVNANEGGVASGYSVLDSPTLV